MTNNELVDDDFVSKKAAVALSKVGYDAPLHTHYLVGMGDMVCRPILQKAVEWLRERHNISLRINYAMKTRNWFFDYLNMADGSYDDSTSIYDDTTGYYDSYNDAVNAGIIAICEYIKDNEDTTGKENPIG